MKKIILLSELWLYDNEIIHTCGGIIAPRVPCKLGTCGAIIPPRVWIISLSYNQSSDNTILYNYQNMPNIPLFSYIVLSWATFSWCGMGFGHGVWPRLSLGFLPTNQFRLPVLTVFFSEFCWLKEQKLVQVGSGHSKKWPKFWALYTLLLERLLKPYD